MEISLSVQELQRQLAQRDALIAALDSRLHKLEDWAPLDASSIPSLSQVKFAERSSVGSSSSSSSSSCKAHAENGDTVRIARVKAAPGFKRNKAHRGLDGTRMRRGEESMDSSKHGVDASSPARCRSSLGRFL